MNFLNMFFKWDKRSKEFINGIKNSKHSTDYYWNQFIDKSSGCYSSDFRKKEVFYQNYLNKNIHNYQGDYTPNSKMDNLYEIIKRINEIEKKGYEYLAKKNNPEKIDSFIKELGFIYKSWHAKNDIRYKQDEVEFIEKQVIIKGGEHEKNILKNVKIVEFIGVDFNTKWKDDVFKFTDNIGHSFNASVNKFKNYEFEENKNRTKLIKEICKDEKQNGEWIDYYVTGNIKIKENLKDWKKNGKIIGYYETGQIEYKGNYEMKTKYVDGEFRQSLFEDWLRDEMGLKFKNNDGVFTVSVKDKDEAWSVGQMELIIDGMLRDGMFDDPYSTQFEKQREIDKEVARLKGTDLNETIQK